jgi:hypothetical protein
LNPNDPQQRAWCYFRNVVHTAYREARHLGPPEDSEAKLRVTDSVFASAARLCSKNRKLLKGTSLFNETASALSVDDVLQRYRNATALALEDLETLFSRPGWTRGYGGPKWAVIARAAITLAQAVKTGDPDPALLACRLIQGIEHNTRKLVPTAEEWRSTPYLREKWPELCN